MSSSTGPVPKRYVSEETVTTTHKDTITIEVNDQDDLKAIAKKLIQIEDGQPVLNLPQYRRTSFSDTSNRPRRADRGGSPRISHGRQRGGKGRSNKYDTDYDDTGDQSDTRQTSQTSRWSKPTDVDSSSRPRRSRHNSNRRKRLDKRRGGSKDSSRKPVRGSNYSRKKVRRRPSRRQYKAKRRPRAHGGHTGSESSTAEGGSRRGWRKCMKPMSNFFSSIRGSHSGPRSRDELLAGGKDDKKKSKMTKK
ncbi:uncharacterized protein LOC111273204, partial [Varroa jacobsoni]|uniref:uncharacterized protein LOC111273204 n=1 Tax=Varroa jacobsoni TaxID=62625 RepID=UPI000BF4B6B1